MFSFGTIQQSSSTSPFTTARKIFVPHWNINKCLRLPDSLHLEPFPTHETKRVANSLCACAVSFSILPLVLELYYTRVRLQIHMNIPNVIQTCNSCRKAKRAETYPKVGTAEDWHRSKLSDVRKRRAMKKYLLGPRILR